MQGAYPWRIFKAVYGPIWFRKVFMGPTAGRAYLRLGAITDLYGIRENTETLFEAMKILHYSLSFLIYLTKRNFSPFIRRTSKFLFRLACRAVSYHLHLLKTKIV